MVSIPEENAREIIRIVDELGKYYDDAYPEVGFGTSLLISSTLENGCVRYSCWMMRKHEKKV